ncbi:Inner membrane protein yebS [Shimwellia blattae]|nr:Inner membrane protein yebS [Shimwellia blattae]
MAIKPTYIPDGKPLRLDKIGVALPRPRYQRCLSCDALYLLPTVKCTQNAWCPRCHAKVHNGMDWSLTRLAAMALTMLLLMPFAWSEPLLRIWLLGAHSDASLLQGVWQMAHQGDVITAAMVLFCSVAAPVILVVAIGYLWLGNILNMNLRPILLMLDRLKEWVMLDIYLVGIMVASIKVQDYAWIQPGTGLFAFVSLTILSVMTVIHLNTEELWTRFYPQPAARYNTDKLCVCIGCEYTGLPDARGRCQRCHSPLRARKKNSLQKTWAALICSIIFLVPANLLPISVVYVNGARQEDTIISGVLSLAQDNIAVAGVVFVASILVPFFKSDCAAHPVAEYSFPLPARAEEPHPVTALYHLGRPLVDAGSVCHFTYHVAYQPRSIIGFYHGTRCVLVWIRSDFHYSCCAMAGQPITLGCT